MMWILIKECRDLETWYTDEIMTDAEGFSVRVKRKVLRSVDKDKILEKC